MEEQNVFGFDEVFVIIRGSLMIMRLLDIQEYESIVIMRLAA